MKKFGFLNRSLKGISILFLSIFACSSCIAQGSASKPNIVIIFADDWGWGDLAVHGHKELKTPNIDKLASQGTDFYRFTVGNPVCSPSRTALMTGQYPARHAIHDAISTHEKNASNGVADWLDPKVTLLPRLLKEAGYTTAHYGKWHLSLHGEKNVTPEVPLPAAYGYDDAAIFTGPGKSVWEGSSYADKNVKGSENTFAAYLTAAATEHAIRFITENKDRPFFLNLWIHETHTIVAATDEDKKAYPNTPEPQLTYYASITRADKLIGQVLETLKKLGLEKNTIVIFSSDNGPEDPSDDKDHVRYHSVGSTGGLRGRKRSLYMGGVGTPFIVRWPGKVPAGRIDRTSVITGVDILPTLCAAANIPLPKGYAPDGVNVLPALKGEKFTRGKPIFWEWRGTHSREANWPELAIQEGDMKLIMSRDPKRVELYDVLKDRDEENNLAEANPKLVREMMKKLLDWKATLPPDTPGANKKGGKKDDDDN